MQKSVYLNDASYACIKKYMEQNNMNNFSGALNAMIAEYDSTRADTIADLVVEKLTEKYDKALTRIRLASNTSDINTQIILEILNSIAYRYDIKAVTTSVHETSVLTDSRKEVKDKIAYYKQIKDSKSKKSK